MVADRAQIVGQRSQADLGPDGTAIKFYGFVALECSRLPDMGRGRGLWRGFARRLVNSLYDRIEAEGSRFRFEPKGDRLQACPTESRRKFPMEELQPWGRYRSFD